MRPNETEVLQGIVGALGTYIMPELQSEHAKLEMMLISVVLGSLATELDGAAQKLVDDNAALRELAGRGIRVNAVAPGIFDVGMAQRMDHPAREARIQELPMGRAGRSEELASAVVFLASDDASYVTGQTIYADGGRLPLNYTVPVAE